MTFQAMRLWRENLKILTPELLRRVEYISGLGTDDAPVVDKSGIKDRKHEFQRVKLNFSIHLTLRPTTEIDFTLCPQPVRGGRLRLFSFREYFRLVIILYMVRKSFILPNSALNLRSMRRAFRRSQFLQAMCANISFSGDVTNRGKSKTLFLFFLMLVMLKDNYKSIS